MTLWMFRAFRPQADATLPSTFSLLGPGLITNLPIPLGASHPYYLIEHVSACFFPCPYSSVCVRSSATVCAVLRCAWVAQPSAYCCNQSNQSSWLYAAHTQVLDQSRFCIVLDTNHTSAQLVCNLPSTKGATLFTMLPTAIQVPKSVFFSLTLPCLLCFAFDHALHNQGFALIFYPIPRPECKCQK